MFNRIFLIIIVFLLLFIQSCHQQPKLNSTTVKKDSVQTDKVLDYFKSKEVSKEQLMEEAKKRNIPFRKEENGVIYELHSFDEHSGMPIYYTTKDGETQNPELSTGAKNNDETTNLKK